MMKKRLFSTVLLMMSVLAMPLAVSAATDKAPLEKWDFGYVPQKSEVSWVFYVRNPGTKPLTVTNIKAGCSCTSVSKLDGPIAPGDSAGITVTFNSGRYQSRVQKTTLVETDVPETPKLRYSILANVYSETDTTGFINALPGKLVWPAKIGQQQFAPATVEFTNRLADSVRIEVLSMPDTLLNWSLSAMELAPGGKALLQVTPLKAIAARKITDVTATLRFAKGRATIITIPLEFEY
jgi:hypothetical protein